jgi:hypothetical protein
LTAHAKAQGQAFARLQALTGPNLENPLDKTDADDKVIENPLDKWDTRDNLIDNPLDDRKSANHRSAQRD